ncbi:hypothetical protein HYX58_04355 [Candidatus Dependentiae bacterium]|nr:hypothetical protein [Candidatus Dependentiae bacterium]
MRVKQFWGLCFLFASVVRAEETLFLKKLLFSKEIACGTALLGAAWYYDAGYIESKCTTYQPKKIWKKLSRLEFTKERKEIVFSNDEIKKKIKLMQAPSYSEEIYEFYDRDCQLIAPASPVLGKEDCIDDLSEIKIVRKQILQKEVTVFKRNCENEWIRKIIIEVPETVMVAKLDEQRLEKLLLRRKIAQSVGCGCILLGATRSLYNWLYP